jgi:hypothetical protein
VRADLRRKAGVGASDGQPGSNNAMEGRSLDNDLNPKPFGCRASHGGGARREEG